MQLRSIAEQTCVPSEVVVCDDGSEDETLAILEDWKRSVPFLVRVLRNAKNLGYTKNFERAVTECRGEIILLADHDDVWLPNRVETVCRWFERDPELGLVTSDARLINAAGEDQGMTLREFVERMHLREFWRFFFPDDAEMVLWTGCAMALRRRFLAPSLPIPATMACHDIWFYVTFALDSKIAFIPEPLLQYRLHGGNHSTAPTVEFLRAHPSQWHYFNAFSETLRSQHPRLMEELEAFARSLPQTPRIERFLRALKRHQRHFEARGAASVRPAGILSEILNGGYLTHPEPIRSILYDLREALRHGK